MAVKVSVETFTDGVLDDGLRRLSGNLAAFGETVKADGTRLERFMDEQAAILLSRIRARYLDEMAPDGTKWPRSAAAEKRISQGFTGRKTLYDSGRLFHSIQIAKSSGAKFTGRTLGTDVPYAAKHQEGTDGMLRRPFLGFSAADIKVLEAAANKFVTDRLEETL